MHPASRSLPSQYYIQNSDRQQIQLHGKGLKIIVVHILLYMDAEKACKILKNEKIILACTIHIYYSECMHDCVYGCLYTHVIYDCQ